MLFVLSNVLLAQQPKHYSSAEVYHMLEGMNTFGSALYIAAHPDDENTRLITYLSKHEHIRTSYISLTRGDGGQNMIGTELGSQLGLIRTNELLAARKKDGGQQYFTRANDFGYSKNYEETLTIWDEEQVLADLVYVIRKLKPDVLITRFPPLSYNYPTHGHHSTSAYLAEKAFDLAGDMDAYPGQLETVEIWQPKRLYWNTSTWFYRRTGEEMDTTDKVMYNVGAYLPTLGMAVSEIASDSRSQHKSQGFGSAWKRGEQKEYLEFVKGEMADGDLFDGVETTWARLPKSTKAKEAIDRALAKFDAGDPSAILPELLEAYKVLGTLKDSYWKTVKLEQLKELIAAASGLYLEVVADAEMITPGGELKLTAEAIHRSGTDVRMSSVSLLGKQAIEWKAEQMGRDRVQQEELTLVVPETVAFSQPYWLKQAQENVGMYKVADQAMRGPAIALSELIASISMTIGGVALTYDMPIQYKWTDRVKGELYKEVKVVPAITLAPNTKAMFFTGEEAKELSLTVKAWKAGIAGELSFDLPDGWTTEPAQLPIAFENVGDEKLVKIKVTPGKKSGSFQLDPKFTVDTKTYASALVEIDYDHIPYQTILQPAAVKLLKLDLETTGNKLGYIMGAGDEVGTYLEQIGYSITAITEDNIGQIDLSQFDAILIGIRAYNTEKWLPAKKELLMNYVAAGGNMIVQYQTTRGLLTDDIGPYPMKLGRGRVTVETATMKMLNAKHPIFNAPNKITDADLENWVQERGLYFAETWDEKYEPLFEMNDPGEDPLQGSLIVADHGKGTFVFTGISFFRELPAGVTGAFRLLTNIISYEQQ